MKTRWRRLAIATFSTSHPRSALGARRRALHPCHLYLARTALARPHSAKCGKSYVIPTTSWPRFRMASGVTGILPMWTVIRKESLRKGTHPRHSLHAHDLADLVCVQQVGLGYGDESPVGDCRPTPNMMHASSTVTPMMRSNSTVATSLSALVRSQSTVGGVGRKVSAMFKGASRPDVLHISRVSHGSSGHGSSGLPSWSAREKSDSRQSRQSRSQRMSRDRKSHSR
eukprot:3345389-Prymnesium_polylepis.2